MNDAELMRAIVRKKDSFERAYNLSPNIIFLGNEIVPLLFPDLSKFKKDSALYIYGMQVYIDHHDTKRVSIGYLTTCKSIYRNENCDRKHKCDDYKHYHCTGCNGAKGEEL